MRRKRIVIGIVSVLALALAVGYVLILPVYVEGETLPAVRIDAETGAVEATRLRFQGEWVTRRWNVEPPRFHGVISVSAEREETGEAEWTNFIVLGEDQIFGSVRREEETLDIHAAEDLQSFFCEEVLRGEEQRVGGYVAAPAQTVEEAETIARELGLGVELP